MFYRITCSYAEKLAEDRGERALMLRLDGACQTEGDRLRELLVGEIGFVKERRVGAPLACVESSLVENRTQCTSKYLRPH